MLFNGYILEETISILCIVTLSYSNICENNSFDS